MERQQASEGEIRAEPTLGSHVARIAGVLASDGFPTADRASLRRMAPGQPPPLAFYRFAIRYLPEGWEHALPDWITLVASMALMAPGIHRPDRGLGKALAESGYSEARLERLLAAEGDTLRSLLMRAARFLASKSAPFNWNDGARMILTRDNHRRERIRLRVARDFYSQTFNQKKSN
ncbi:MAG: type I-E CRISPR-associated protein Cse2/CasB [Deltaproteobacteria bacterium]|nr:MAG: type I-E CRISPR-associated protein Cse2/CasB [Deltaproteobacteria bacterium]